MARRFELGDVVSCVALGRTLEGAVVAGGPRGGLRVRYLDVRGVERLDRVEGWALGTGPQHYECVECSIRFASERLVGADARAPICPRCEAESDAERKAAGAAIRNTTGYLIAGRTATPAPAVSDEERAVRALEIEIQQELDELESPF